MKYKVIKTFRDKNTKEYHEIDSVYEANEERAAELTGMGFLGEEVKNPLEKILDQSVEDLTEPVKNELSIEQLEELLKFEKAGKKRKTVIKLIEDTLGDKDESS